LRKISLAKVFAVACAWLAAVAVAPSAFAQTACSAFSVTAARLGGTPLNLGPFSLALGAGDTITLIDGAGGFPTNTLTVGSTSSSFTNVGSTSIVVATAGTYTVSAALGPPAPPGTASLFCTPGRSTSVVPQNISNAQTAAANGLRTLQNYQEWVTKGILGTFGMTRGGDIATAPRREAPSAASRQGSLATEAREAAEELASLPTDDERSTGLKHRLESIRRDMNYARVSARVSSPQAADAVDATSQAPGEPDGVKSARLPAAPEIHLGTCDLSDACQATAPDGARWNVWLEGRVVGATDSVARTNALGFAGATGADYKVLPWLALGLSVGVESYETSFGVPGMRTGSVGVTALPYFGMRLHENVYAEGFVGFTKLNYNTNPSAGISGAFDAYRIFVGGALTGVWYEGQWRIQPSILGAYGTESQNGYTDSSGTAVFGQTISYGRIAAGPEIGYTFRDEARNWSFEPFVIAKANVDFASSPVYSFNNGTTIVRAGTQAFGLLGVGMAMQLDRGFYLRLQASYDSIGVSGLDVWSGRLRAGINF
jgi:hypothetical protein